MHVGFAPNRSNYIWTIHINISLNLLPKIVYHINLKLALWNNSIVGILRSTGSLFTNARIHSADLQLPSLVAHRIYPIESSSWEMPKAILWKSNIESMSYDSILDYMIFMKTISQIEGLWTFRWLLENLWLVGTTVMTKQARKWLSEDAHYQ